MKLVTPNQLGINNLKGEDKSEYPADYAHVAGAEMEWATAPCIIERLTEFSKNGLYGATMVRDEYINAIIWWMKETRDLDIKKEYIVPTLGTIFGFYTTIRAFSEEGDGVIIIAPIYHHFAKACRLTLRETVENNMIDMGGYYELDMADLEEKMKDPKNKILAICNPSNPTSKVITEKDLRQIAQWAEKYNVVVFCDEIFGEFHNVPFTSLAKVGSKNLITSTSFGKSFNFTGTNHANMIITDKELREKYIVYRDRDHFGSLDPFYNQALIAAYTPEGKAWFDVAWAQCNENYNYIKTYLAEHHPEIKIFPFDGSYIAWIDFRALGLSNEQLDDWLLNTAHIVGDPGTRFGSTGGGYYRFPIASDMSTIKRFMSNLTMGIEALKK